MWPAVFASVVYLFSIFARFGSVIDIIQSDFSSAIQIQQLINLPLEVLYNSTTPTGIFFILNTALVATYLTLLAYLIHSRAARYRKAVGAAGSILAILSVGCAACGSLITPALIAISSIVPLSLFGHINIILSMASTILLLFALRFLVKRIRE